MRSDTQLMVILNATPDSYYPPSRIDNQALYALQERIRTLENDGADIFDIGGESTRPGATPISSEEELSRVLPLLECIASVTKKPISIDTTKPLVAKMAIERGASIINDIGGFGNEKMRRIAEAFPHTRLVLMHMKGVPKTMQQDPIYREGVVDEVHDFFCRRLDLMEREGISQGRVILDPGIGFGKTLNDNLLLMQSIERFRAIGQTLYGVSRKLWIKALLQRDLEERLPATLAAASFLIERGVNILRVHDVRQHRDVVMTISSLQRPVRPSCVLPLRSDPVGQTP